MTREDQDKLWAELTLKVQEEMKAKYAKFSAEDNPQSKGYCQGLANVFGEHNLKPKLKEYWEIEKELFNHKAAQWLSYYIIDWDKPHSTATQIVKSDCTSRKQAEKLLAMNRLLNVAKFLNKNEDGSDWVPDFKNKDEKTNKIWSLGIDEDDNKIRPYFVDLFGARSEFVYFRTMEIAQQAVQILGEDVVMTALTTDY